MGRVSNMHFPLDMQCRCLLRKKSTLGCIHMLWPHYYSGALIQSGKTLNAYLKHDQHGHTIDFLLTEHRDTEAALRFLKKAIRRNGLPEPITIDGSDANEAAIKRYNQEYGTAITIRQVKYLNNVVEQDHRGVKRVTRPMLGFKAFDAAQATVVGIELMHMLRKGQLAGGSEQSLTAAEQFYALAA